VVERDAFMRIRASVHVVLLAVALALVPAAASAVTVDQIDRKSVV